LAPLYYDTCEKFISSYIDISEQFLSGVVDTSNTL
jgi:hypothetical protein